MLFLDQYLQYKKVIRYIYISFFLIYYLNRWLFSCHGQLPTNHPNFQIVSRRFRHQMRNGMCADGQLLWLQLYDVSGCVQQQCDVWAVDGSPGVRPIRWPRRESTERLEGVLHWCTSRMILSDNSHTSPANLARFRKKQISWDIENCVTGRGGGREVENDFQCSVSISKQICFKIRVRDMFVWQ